MEGRAQQSEDFAAAFEAAFARLQVLLEMACAGDGPWHERAIVAIRRALEFAAAEPDAASLLTNRALAEGVDGVERYERLMGYLASLLEGGRAESPHGTDLPATTERSIAGGVATIIANRVNRGAAEEVPRLLPEMVQFVLTPYLGTVEATYLGTEEAKRIAAGDWPPSQFNR